MKILILGVGNILCADEGVGVIFVKWFESIYKIHHANTNYSLDFIDGGTLCMQLTPIISKYDKMILCDCIDSNTQNVADVFFFDYKDIPNNINFQGSAHEVETFAMLNFMDILNDLPKTHILAIKPNRIEQMSLEISSDLAHGIQTMENTLKSELEKLGFVLTKTNNTDIFTFAKKYASFSNK